MNNIIKIFAIVSFLTLLLSGSLKLLLDYDKNHPCIETETRCLRSYIQTSYNVNLKIMMTEIKWLIVDCNTKHEKEVQICTKRK